MRKFNLEEAKKGKPVMTRSGDPARILCFDRISALYPIVALVTRDDEERVLTFNEEGRYNGSGSINEQEWDLMMASEEREGWIVIYEMDGKFCVDNKIYETEAKAEIMATDSELPTFANIIGVQKITFKY